jgi:hypothetical protein
MLCQAVKWFNLLTEDGADRQTDRQYHPLDQSSIIKQEIRLTHTSTNHASLSVTRRCRHIRLREKQLQLAHTERLSSCELQFLRFRYDQRGNIALLNWLTSALKLAAFWYLAPCTQIEVDRHFIDASLSGRRCMKYAPPKRRCTSTRLHGGISQKAIMLNSPPRQP